MNIISPYKNVEQYTRVLLEPYQMNSDILHHLKFNLEKKVEKKCNLHGYIEKVYKITNYSDGYMIPENLSGSAIYNISYYCKLCIPIENSIIIGQIKVINQELIVANNGPIMIFIPRNNIDSTYWNNTLTYININTNKPLEIDNYACIQILNKKINNNDTQIKTIGKLLELATEDQVNQYFKFSEENIDETNFI